MAESLTPPKAVLVAAWGCLCHRCGHAWTSVCDCGIRLLEGPKNPREIHKRGCGPPGWCPKCKSGAWTYALDLEGPGRRGAPKKPIIIALASQARGILDMVVKALGAKSTDPQLFVEPTTGKTVFERYADFRATAHGHLPGAFPSVPGSHIELYNELSNPQRPFDRTACRKLKGELERDLARLDAM